jgi:hypothetical protein
LVQAQTICKQAELASAQLVKTTSKGF